MSNNTPSSNSTPITLTIAGSDSGDGAGIQSDLKDFSALGVYSANVITAITAQSTQAVAAVLNTQTKKPARAFSRYSASG